MVLVRFDVPDVEHARHTLVAYGEELEQLTEQARQRGAVSHRFAVSDDGRLVVVDLWNDPASFRAFFQGNQTIGEITQAAQVQGEPDVEILNVLEGISGTF